MRLVLDAGALIALERDDRVMWRRLKLLQVAGESPISHGGIVGQVGRPPALTGGASSTARVQS